MLVSVNKKTVFVFHVPCVASYGVAMSAASDSMQCTLHIASARATGTRASAAASFFKPELEFTCNFVQIASRPAVAWVAALPF